MPKITSDGTSDPTVAGQQVLPRLDLEADWRTLYACKTPDTCAGVDDPSQACEGCRGLMELLARLRPARRERYSTTREPSEPKARKGAIREIY